MVLDVLAQDATIVLTLLLLEAVLSFDNAAILAAMVRRLPREDRRKALLYGLLGAYALRITTILLAAWLIKTPVLKVVGGSYLVFLFLKHFTQLIRHAGDDHHQVSMDSWLMRLGMPPLLATILQIELVDLAFALDQVVVAVGFTDKIFLIIIAALLGILFLRLAASYLARVMDWLPLLEHMAYVAVGFVGVKLILLFWDLHIPDVISVGITLGLFGVPVLLKLVFDIPKGHPGAHVRVEHPVRGRSARDEDEP